MDLIRSLDESILFGVQALHNPTLDSIMVFITRLNDNGFLWIAIGLLCILNRSYRKYGITVLLSLLFSLLFTNIIIKNLVQRIRPFETFAFTPLILESSWSFPSGHTSSSFAAAVALTLGLKWKGVPFLFVALLIAFTRLYVQVHYFSDILAGAVIGSLCGVLATLTIRKARKIIIRQ